MHSHIKMARTPVGIVMKELTVIPELKVLENLELSRVWLMTASRRENV